MSPFSLLNPHDEITKPYFVSLMKALNTNDKSNHQSLLCWEQHVLYLNWTHATWVNVIMNYLVRASCNIYTVKCNIAVSWSNGKHKVCDKFHFNCIQVHVLHWLNFCRTKCYPKMYDERVYCHAIFTVQLDEKDRRAKTDKNTHGGWILKQNRGIWRRMGILVVGFGSRNHASPCIFNIVDPILSSEQLRTSISFMYTFRPESNV